MNFKISILAAAYLLVQSAVSVSVNGYIGGACMGERLWGYDIPTFQNCQGVSQYVASRSVVMGSFNAGQVVYVYSSGDCSGNPIYTSDSLVCYVAPDDNVGSFAVFQAISRRGGGSLREIA